MDDQFLRQATMVDMDKLREVQVTMVGAGGIGSVAASFLTKMGVRNLEVFDHDSVELHNISNQMYPISAVGKQKVDALAEHIYHMEGVEITPRNEQFTKDHKGSEILIMAVDSMAARSAIWDAAKHSADTVLVLDGRMGSWVCHRLAVRLDEEKDLKYYEGTLFSDEDAIDLPCTERAIIFNTAAIGSMISDCVAKYCTDDRIARHIVYDMKNSNMLELTE